MLVAAAWATVDLGEVDLLDDASKASGCKFCLLLGLATGHHDFTAAEDECGGLRLPNPHHHGCKPDIPQGKAKNVHGGGGSGESGGGRQWRG